MTQSTSTIRADFDRIAQFSAGGWDHNSHYHDFLLRHVSEHCADVLEIGCGTGAFTRRLARRSNRVLALDLSPQMIRMAGDRSKQSSNIDFQVANAMVWKFPIEQYDCVASIAALHHLPLREMLSKIRTALKPNGVLVVLDLYAPEGISDILTSLLAIPVSYALRLIKKGWRRESKQEREAWAEHWQHDSFVTLSEIRQVCAEKLPGAEVRRHLLWRYSIVWQKPRGAE